jgi:hypothetical protein
LSITIKLSSCPWVRLEKSSVTSPPHPRSEFVVGTGTVKWKCNIRHFPIHPILLDPSRSSDWYPQIWRILQCKSLQYIQEVHINFFTVTAFHSIKNTRLLNRIKSIQFRARIKVEGRDRVVQRYDLLQTTQFYFRYTSLVTDQYYRHWLHHTETNSSHSVSNAKVIIGEETRNDTHVETIEKPPLNNNRNNPDPGEQLYEIWA